MARVTSSKKKKKRTSSGKPAALPTQRQQSLPYSGPDNPVLDEEGKIKQWTANCRDGHDLKVYVEYGAADGLSPTQVQLKFPQFNKYSYSTFNSALQNVKKSANAQVLNQKQVNCEYVIIIFIYCFYNF